MSEEEKKLKQGEEDVGDINFEKEKKDKKKKKDKKAKKEKVEGEASDEE
jgi:hypothetical protein